MSDPMVRAERLVKGYGRGEARVSVLEGCDLEVSRGEMLGVVGPSGIGKSTLLHVVGLLDRPDGGVLEIDKRPVDGLSAVERARVRNEIIGFVFQYHYLMDELNAVDNVALPLRISGFSRSPARRRAEELLERVGLSDRRRHYPDELSGGEQQRVAVARALAAGPSLLLADEPTGNVDRRNADRVFSLIRELHLLEGLTSVIVTHNEELAGRCDRVVRLVPGGRVQSI